MKKVLSVILALLMLLTLLNYSSLASVDNHNLYYIKNAKSGKYLTVSNGNIIQSDLNNEEHQRFRIESSCRSNNTQYYNIITELDYDYRIDVDGALDQVYQNIKVFTENSDYPAAQSFCFIPQSNGTYQIMPLLSNNKVLDVENASTSSGANIQLYTQRSESDSNVSAQQWYLVSVKTSLLSWDLVSLKHLDWDASDSSYESYVEFGANVWNSYKSDVIRKDNLLRTCELKIIDEPNVGNAVAYTTTNGQIIINTTTFASLSDEFKKNTLIHELGHALGMGHINDSSNVLYYAVNSTITLDSKNQFSYDLAYERY